MGQRKVVLFNCESRVLLCRRARRLEFRLSCEDFVTCAGGQAIESVAVLLAQAPGCGVALNDEVARHHLPTRSAATTSEGWYD